MRTPKNSIRKIVKYLNNPDEEGGFWLPNIQRSFVWTEEQICRLFDSIMRDYPIGTLLVWKTYSGIRHRRFIDSFKRAYNENLSVFYITQNEKKKCLVLDGQQRLQALFIGLCGDYEGRELFFDVLSGHVTLPDDIKYRFVFLNPGIAASPYVRLKDIVFSNEDPLSVAERIIGTSGQELTEDQRKMISRNVGLVFQRFHSEDGMTYQEVDSTDNKDLYSEDDVVEIFIRANAGGTTLNKSDLLFALLSSSWDEADIRMEGLLEDLNRHGFAFTRDFVLKTCLTLLDQGARYEVTKFRKPGVREQIEQNWEDIASSIKDVLDYVRGKTYIRCDKALPSYLVLIPLIYVRYVYPQAWKHITGTESFILRSLLARAFSGTPDQLIDNCVDDINEVKGFDRDRIVAVIRSSGRSLEITEDKLWEIGYGSDAIHLLFNLWYKDFNYTPSYENNLPQVDHIFPQSQLKKVTVVNPETGRHVMKFWESERNQLANCMLLTQEENGFGGKCDIPPDIWFADKDSEYLKLHAIPPDPALWKVERFEDFVAERKKLILIKLHPLLQRSDSKPMQSGDTAYSSRRNPPWHRDELILALDLYRRLNFAHNCSDVGANRAEIEKLSRILNLLPVFSAAERGDSFRNPNGVYMKLCNYLAFDPDYNGEGLHAGGKLDREVWDEFSGNRTELARRASAILSYYQITE